MGRGSVGELLREGAGARVTLADIAMCILGGAAIGVVVAMLVTGDLAVTP